MPTIFRTSPVVVYVFVRLSGRHIEMGLIMQKTSFSHERFVRETGENNMLEIFIPIEQVTLNITATLPKGQWMN